MAFMFGDGIFFHIPKTGGMWVRDIFQKMHITGKELPCVCCRERNQVNGCCFHANYKTAMIPDDGRKRFTFAFVRHPLSYYQSYWACKMRAGWAMNNAFDRRFALESFPEFVEAVVRFNPGWVTGAYEWFIGSEDAPMVDFVGKQETLRLDLLRALRRAGQDSDEMLLLDSSPKNVASMHPDWRDKCRFTPELEEAVRQSERGAMVRFGYW